MMLKNRKAYYLVYSLIFALVAFFGICLFFLKDGVTVFKSWDTYDQQYMAFVRIGRWLRTIIREGKIQVWSPSVGYGADIFISLSPYITDPFNWLSVAIPSAWAETAFTAVLFLKTWLTGITFSLLAFHRKNEPYAALCGALSYAVSGTAFLCLYQSQFFMPMILFPLVIMGADKLFDEGKPVLYVLTLAWSAFNSFYHTYMIAIIVAGYVLLRWLFQPKEAKTCKLFFRLILSFFLYAVLAAGMAAVSLLPVAKTMTSMSRIGLRHEVPLFYPGSYYAEILRGMLMTVPVGADAYIGFSAIAVGCVFLLFVVRNKNLCRIKTELVLLLFVLCVPAFGYALNGFVYVTSRWVWALTFLLAYMVTMLLPEAKRLGNRQCILYLFLLLTYIAAVFVFAGGLNTYLYPWICGLLFLFGLFLVLGRKLKDTHFQRIAVLLTAAGVFMLSLNRFSNGLTDYKSAGDLYEKTASSGGMPLLDEIDVTDGSRYTDAGLGNIRNASWLHENASGINFYMSFYNDRIDQFHNSVALLTGPSPFMYNYLNNRSELLAILGVNHVFTKANAKGHVLPIGCTAREAEKDGLVSMKTDTSIVSLFDESMTTAEFNGYTPIQRQQILLQKIILEKTISEKTHTFPVLNEQEIHCLISVLPETTVVSETGIKTIQEDQELILSFPEQSDGELYLYFDNLFYEHERTEDTFIRVSAWNDQTKVLSQQMRLNTPWSHIYGGKHQWLINLGRIPDFVNSIRVAFSKQGNYSWTGLHVYVCHTGNVLKNIEQLSHDNTSIMAGNNQYSITTDLKEKKYLLLAVPFSEGWKATDNGADIEVLNADIGFMGLELEPGRHEIEFCYQTPGFPLGLMISTLSLCIFISTIVWNRRYDHLAGSGKIQDKKATQ